MPNSITITVEESNTIEESDKVLVDGIEFGDWIGFINIDTTIDNVTIDCPSIYTFNIIEECVSTYRFIDKTFNDREITPLLLHKKYLVLKIYDTVNKLDENEEYQDKCIPKHHIDNMYRYFENLDENRVTLTFKLSNLRCNILFNGELIDENTLINRLLNNRNMVISYRLIGNVAKEPYLSQLNTTIKKLVENDIRFMSLGDKLILEHNTLSLIIFFLVEKRRIGLGHQYSEGLDDYAKQCYDWETK